MGGNAPRIYHAPVWSEPLILELTSPGERGILTPAVDEEIKKAVGDASSLVPASARRIKAWGPAP
jgi:glycine dehydrogenase subunit 2